MGSYGYALLFAHLNGGLHNERIAGMPTMPRRPAAQRDRDRLQARRLRDKVNPLSRFKLLSLERREAMNRRAVNLAFPMVTAGLLLGVVLLRQYPVPAEDWLSVKVVGTVGLAPDRVVATLLEHVGVHAGTPLQGVEEQILLQLRLPRVLATEDTGAGAGQRREEVYATIDRARQELGWSPTIALPEGIDRYLDWLRAELAREEAR